jgi:hypothetical protein
VHEGQLARTINSYIYDKALLSFPTQVFCKSPFISIDFFFIMNNYAIGIFLLLGVYSAKISIIQLELK